MSNYEAQPLKPQATEKSESSEMFSEEELALKKELFSSPDFKPGFNHLHFKTLNLWNDFKHDLGVLPDWKIEEEKEDTEIDQTLDDKYWEDMEEQYMGNYCKTTHEKQDKKNYSIKHTELQEGEIFLTNSSKNGEECAYIPHRVGQIAYDINDEVVEWLRPVFVLEEDYKKWLEEKNKKNPEVLKAEKTEPEISSDETNESKKQEYITEVHRIQKIEQLAQQSRDNALSKISERLGSNPGGWYEDRKTGKRLYLKFYENPDQARAEFIANAIYEKLGIRVPHATLLEIDGKLAHASEEIADAQPTYREDQKTNPDVLNGFVADAYLGNWDVVGLNYDNIVKSPDNACHRIDNGGSLVFRAQGGRKNFDQQTIPEIANMRKPEFPAGQVFGELTEEEIREQAKHLVYRLTDTFIDKLIDESGLSKELAEEIRLCLHDRKRFLQEHFNIELPECECFRQALAKLNEQRGRKNDAKTELKKQEFELKPMVAIRGDSDKIENFQVDIIDAREDGHLNIYFKLTDQNIQALLNLMDGRELYDEASISYGKGDEKYDLCAAHVIRHESISTYISRGTSEWGKVRAAQGLIHLSVPFQPNGQIDIQAMATALHETLVEYLGLPEGLTAPATEAEKKYKWARYAWHYKMDNNTPPAGWPEIEKKLEYQEVFPEYQTVVEPGKSLEYEKKFGRFVVYHSFHRSIDVIPMIINSGGLMSSHERYRRGAMIEGWSTIADLNQGGGDSVFTRLLTEDGLSTWKSGKYYEDYEQQIKDTIIIFKRSLLDRTDWYAYNSDHYGSTDPNTFYERVSPDDLFINQSNANSPDFHIRANEQMFRTGVGLNDMQAIACRDNETRLTIIQALETSGIKKINGQPIEEFVKIAATYTELLNLSYEAEPGSVKKPKNHFNKIKNLLTKK